MLASVASLFCRRCIVAWRIPPWPPMNTTADDSSLLSQYPHVKRSTPTSHARTLDTLLASHRLAFGLNRTCLSSIFPLISKIYQYFCSVVSKESTLLSRYFELTSSSNRFQLTPCLSLLVYCIPICSTCLNLHISTTFKINSSQNWPHR